MNREAMHGQPAGEGFEGRPAAEILRARMQEIVDSWLERLPERVPIVRDQPRAALVDGIHLFLDQLAEALEPNPPRSDATEGSSVPQEHGSQRVRLTKYRLDDLIVEYQLLREVVLGTLGASGPLTRREHEVVNRSFDRAIVEAASAYMLAHATARERFMVQVAHDLRGPLSAIQATPALHGDRFVLRAPETVTGYWSCSAMCRAVESLLANAIKYGARDKQVTVSVTRQGEGALVAVQNHGSYIAPGEREAIFEVFHRADAVRRGREAGWGVGLGIVRGIGEAHGGAIALDSDPERGTTFFIHLPHDSRPFQPPS